MVVERDDPPIDGLFRAKMLETTRGMAIFNGDSYEVAQFRSW
jgi:hypothetical protein